MFKPIFRPTATVLALTMGLTGAAQAGPLNIWSASRQAEASTPSVEQVQYRRYYRHRHHHHNGISPGAAAAIGIGAVAAGRRGLFLLTLIFVTASAIFAIVSIHLLTFLQALGFALPAAVALGTLVGPSQVGARVIEIVFGSRYHPIWTLVAAAVLICAGVLLLYFGFPVAAACLVIYGAGNGIWSIARGTVPLALFGPEDFPAIMGRLAKAAFLSQAAAPFIAAQIITRADEHAALAALAALAVLNLGLVLCLLARLLPRS
jgi:hypothetical protein